MATCLILNSCGSEQATPEETAAIEEVVKKNLEAIISVEPKDMRKTGIGIDRSWHEHAVLHATETEGYHPSIKDFKIIEYSEKEALVELTIFEKSSDADYPNQQYTSQRRLKKNKGDWKVALPFVDSERIEASE